MGYYLKVFKLMYVLLYTALKNLRRTNLIIQDFYVYFVVWCCYAYVLFVYTASPSFRRTNRIIQDFYVYFGVGCS